ncbi:MAG: phenylalanine--tRNA ligase beta subunit-related protein [Candidatus Micrarchaeota archaeon]
MKFVIDEKVFQKFSSLNIGVIVARDISNVGNLEEVQQQLRVIENEVRANNTVEALSQNPKIDIWRKAYSSFGAKPKKNKSSVENLYSLVLRGVNLSHINNLVDVYNFISLKHMVPVGGEDIDKLQGDVVLMFAESNEPAVLLLGDKEPSPPHAGEVIYKDEVSAICRRWNWREADRTKLTEETKNCILVIEGLSPVTKRDIESVTIELKELVQKFCGGNLTYKILDETQPEMKLDGV